MVNGVIFAHAHSIFIHYRANVVDSYTTVIATLLVFTDCAAVS